MTWADVLLPQWQVVAAVVVVILLALIVRLASDE
jgi:hypothetical protein